MFPRFRVLILSKRVRVPTLRNSFLATLGSKFRSEGRGFLVPLRFRPYWLSWVLSCDLACYLGLQVTILREIGHLFLIPEFWVTSLRKIGHFFFTPWASGSNLADYPRFWVSSLSKRVCSFFIPRVPSSDQMGKCHELILVSTLFCSKLHINWFELGWLRFLVCILYSSHTNKKKLDLTS